MDEDFPVAENLSESSDTKAAVTQKRKRILDTVDESKKAKLEDLCKLNIDDAVEEVELERTTSMRKFEALKVVFNSLDFKTQKRLRLLCKSWNAIVSLLLQEQSMVKLCENQVKEFIKLRVHGKTLLLPSPFVLFHVDATLLKGPELMNLLTSQETRIARLCLTEPGCYKEDYPENFETILKSHSYHLTHLKLNGITFRIKKYQVERAYAGSPGSASGTPQRPSTYYKNEIEFGREWLHSTYFQLKNKDVKLTLPQLVYFGFSNLSQSEVDDSEQEDSVEEDGTTETLIFILAIINAAPKLETLHFSRIDADLLQKMFSWTNLQNLVTIIATGLTELHLEVFSGLDLPNLKNLTLVQETKLVMGFGDTMNSSMVVDTELLTVIKNFSSSLEFLDITWDWNSFDFDSVPCPRLERLFVKSLQCHLDNLECFTLDLFPVLRDIDVHRYYPYRCTEFVQDPHEGVRTISLDVSNRGLHHFEPLMCSLRQQFPSTQSLKVKLGSNLECAKEFTRCVLLNFPEISSLFFDAKGTFQDLVYCFDRVSSEFTDAYDSGPGDSTPPKVLDHLKALTNLTLSPAIIMTDELARCISRLGNLKLLNFCWPQIPDKLTPLVVIDALKNLKTIVIGNCCKPGTTEVTSEIFMELKTVLCGCRNHDTCFAQDDEIP